MDYLIKGSFLEFFLEKEAPISNPRKRSQVMHFLLHFFGNFFIVHPIGPMFRFCNTVRQLDNLCIAKTENLYFFIWWMSYPEGMSIVGRSINT